jgi:hypothetical protein
VAIPPLETRNVNRRETGGFWQTGRRKHQGKNDNDTSLVNELLLVARPGDLEWNEAKRLATADGFSEPCVSEVQSSSSLIVQC